MNDFALTLSSDPASGLTSLSLGLTAQGGFATVSGAARMVQRVVRWFATPLGSLPYDPTYGNPFFGDLGNPASRDPSQWITWLKQTEYAFLQRQVADVQGGNLSTDETVASFANERAAFPDPFFVALSMDVISLANTTVTLPGPLYFNVAA